MSMIMSVSPPVTLMARKMAIVTVGGGIVGEGDGLHVDYDLRCANCGHTYPMAEQPRALALLPVGATVLPGYAEMCPRCYHDHLAGDVLEVVI